MPQLVEEWAQAMKGNEIVHFGQARQTTICMTVQMNVELSSREDKYMQPF